MVKRYYEGDSFGELALLYNSPRQATIKAKEDSILWSLDRSTYNHIIKESSIKKRDMHVEFLAKVKILENLNDYERGIVADALTTLHFSEGEFVIKENENGDHFYILEEGTAEATKTVEPGKPPQVVEHYSKGDYFGERALLKGEPRAANIVATSDVKIIALSRTSFKSLLGNLTDVMNRKIEDYA